MNLDGPEDNNFIWPKQPDLILVEDIPNKKESNNDQIIDFYSQGKIDNDDEYEEEEDILFDSEIDSISNIRKEVLNDLSKKMIWIMKWILMRMIIIQRNIIIIIVLGSLNKYILNN